jgi:hypothetical protein
VASTLGACLADKDGPWQTYTKASTQGGLPNDFVLALLPGADGALWVGTFGGLARLDKDGRWQTYTKASTQGGLPGDTVRALAPGADGSLGKGARMGSRGLSLCHKGKTGLPAPDRDTFSGTVLRPYRNARLPRPAPRREFRTSIIEHDDLADVLLDRELQAIFEREDDR